MWISNLSLRLLIIYCKIYYKGRIFVILINLARLIN